MQSKTIKIKIMFLPPLWVNYINIFIYRTSSGNIRGQDSESFAKNHVLFELNGAPRKLRQTNLQCV
jgi:hypothetical protein